MCEELETVKRKRTKVERIIEDLRKSYEKETVQTKFMIWLLCVSPLLSKELLKKKILRRLNNAQLDIGKDLKSMK